jgi:UDP-2-acetamido-3-amino-2,3-dideoxy-glucuronate N-acetyltransferase
MVEINCNIFEDEQCITGFIIFMKREYFVHFTSDIDAEVCIGDGTNIWHFSHLQSGCVIGEGVFIGHHVNIGNNVRLGNFVTIEDNVSVYEGVELEDYVFCGPSAVFTNELRPRSQNKKRLYEDYERTHVKKGATIGANATIVCGLTIGEYALIGAGAVVTKNVPAFAKVVGNPGRIVGWVDKHCNDLSFDPEGIDSYGIQSFGDEQVNKGVL